MIIFMCDLYENYPEDHKETENRMSFDFMQDTIVITNRHLVKGDYLQQIRKAVQYHPHALILREKDLDKASYENLAGHVLHICGEEHVTCFLHSHAAVAARLHCRNIHVSIAGLVQLKETGLCFDQISVSCHSLEDVIYAISHGASQIVLGTIFETDCKKGLKGRGLQFVREICAFCEEQGSVPVFAIGGISPVNLKSVKEAGARGGCMMSYAMRDL